MERRSFLDVITRPARIGPPVEAEVFRAFAEAVEERIRPQAAAPKVRVAGEARTGAAR